MRDFPRTATWGAVLVGVLASAGAAFGASAAPGGISAIRRAGSVHPWILSGDLSAASHDPPEVVASATLARHASWAPAATLRAAGVYALAGGEHVVAFTQSIDDVPVVGRGARVVVGGDGRATLLSLELEGHRPDTLDPAIDEAKAIEVAVGRVRALGAVPGEAARARLVVWPTGGAPLLAWAVVFEGLALPIRPVVVVDAATGAPLLEWDAALTVKRARVYDRSPAPPGTLSEVTLDFDATKPGLESELVAARSCMDKETTKTLDLGGRVTLHLCEPVPTITPGPEGDFLHISPRPKPEEVDPFAELSMYHHASKAYAFARSLGFAPTGDVQIAAIANFRFPSGLARGDLKRAADPKVPLARFDNAFFAPRDPLFLGPAFGVSQDALWFGLGTKSSFAYDGDIVYHEFGHFVVSRTIRFPVLPHGDELGISYAPGAMNEAVADLLACFINGDPNVGRYAAAGLGIGSVIRRLDATDVFPDAITGEVHHDSVPFSAAVWATYAPLPEAKRAAFQRATFKALLTAPSGDLGYPDLAQLLGAQVKQDLNAEIAADLERSFKIRGIAPGEGRVRALPPGGGEIRASSEGVPFFAPGRRTFAPSKGGLVPGVFQARFVATRRIGTLKASFRMARVGSVFGAVTSADLDAGVGAPFAPVALAKIGAPIRFTYGPTRHDAIASECATPREGEGTCFVKIDAPAGSVVHFMIANGGDQLALYDRLALQDSDEADQADGLMPPRKKEGACGCAVPGRGEVPAYAAWGGVVGVVAGLSLRRRRRSCAL